MRQEEYLKGILGALGVGADAGVPSPVWNHEAYLAAIYHALKESPIDERVAAAVAAWLEDHPDATTTVEDGAITNAKLASAFVTPGLAAAYSNAGTYAVGDYAFHNGGLYRCTTAISAPESWTAAHWTEAVLGDDVSVLKTALADSLAALKTVLEAQGNTAAVAVLNQAILDLSTLA